MSDEELHNNWTEAKLSHEEYCDYCAEQGVTTVAAVDGATYDGPWAYMCDNHFRSYGRGLGIGKGQRLTYTMEAL